MPRPGSRKTGAPARSSPASDGSASTGRVLIVEDEEPLRRLYERILATRGHTVQVAADGEQALERVRRGTLDVIVSDISMPKMDGLRFLKRIRELDYDVPVILVTGRPAIETAVLAVEYGALLYLVKPVEGKVLARAVEQGVRLHRLADLKREALAQVGGKPPAGDRAGLEAAFARALRSLKMAYQPIVDWSARSVYAYEALLRTNDPVLNHPGALFDAAERLDGVQDVGRSVRARVAEMMESTPGPTMFMNVHPRELLDDQLFDAKAPLTRHARRVVLEITERTSLEEVKDVHDRVASLRKLGFRIAIDDLGAGYAGLTSFMALEPDVVKLDMSLVRNVHSVPTKHKLVRSMVELCREMGLHVVAEGVETEPERDALAGMGCDLMQGFLFAWPGATLPDVNWSASKR